MKIEELLRIKKELFEEADKLSISKGKGYGTKEDTLFNLKLAKILGIADPIVATYIRLLDKITRLARLLQNPNIPHEGIRDTIVDAINYLTYIWALIQETSSSQSQQISYQPSRTENTQVAPHTRERNSRRGRSSRERHTYKSHDAETHVKK